MLTTHYSPQEAAAVSGAPLAAIQKAITNGKIPARSVGPGKRRQLDETTLLAFALVEALPTELRLSASAVDHLLRQSPVGTLRELSIGDLVRIDVDKALIGARRRLQLYRHAQSMLISDPDVLGGMPIVRGTRITAQSLLGRVQDGDSIDSIIEDYPYLDRDTVEAVALYAKANPPRGRPSGKLWRRAS